MSEAVELSITAESIEHLRCSMCKNYLISSPIHVLPNGNNICTQCSPAQSVQMYRQLTLEALLKDAVFPCKFRQQGCSSRLVFRSADDHEATCPHRPAEVANPQLQVKKPPELMSVDGDSAAITQDCQRDAIGSVDMSANVKCKHSINCTATTSTTLNSSTNTETLANSHWQRNANASVPVPGPGSTRSYSSDVNSSYRPSTSSNRNFNMNRNNARVASARMRDFGYDVHWEPPPRYGPRNNNWARNWNDRNDRRQFYMHKRSNRNSVVVIKGGTFYINL